MKNHLFISYARQDEAYADRLSRELRRRGFEPWFDKNIRYGERWPATLEQAVRDCAALILIMTPEAERSHWVRKELDLALDDEKPVFPVLLKGQVFQSVGDVQYADVEAERMPDEGFFGDLTMVPRAKPEVAQYLHKQRSQYEKAISGSPLEGVFRRYEIESGMIDDPEEVKAWEEYLREKKKE